MNEYDITVLTLISKGITSHVKDEITFYNVGESVREMIAGSCKTTLMKLMKLPEDKSPEAYNLKYRTVVKEAGTHFIVSDTKLITFPGMDAEGIKEFKKWAIQQLQETNLAIEQEQLEGPKATKKRNKLLTFCKLLWTRKNEYTNFTK